MLLFLLACDPAKESAPLPIHLRALTPIGEAPWDGFMFETDDNQPHTPLVHDATGAVVPVVVRDIAYQTVWGAEDGSFEAGDYSLDGVDGEDLGWAAPFHVANWGSDPAFDPTPLPGSIWDLDLATMAPLGGVLLSFATATHLILGTPAGEHVPFQIVIESAYGETCQFIAGDGSLDASGNFTWQGQDVAWLSQPPLTATTMGLHLGFGAAAAAGAELDVRADLRDLSSFLYEDNSPTALCTGAASLGETCEPCQDGQQSCAWIGLYGGTLSPSLWTPPEGDLPPCNLIFEEDYIPTIECGCATGGPLSLGLGGVLLALSVIRRRPF